MKTPLGSSLLFFFFFFRRVPRSLGKTSWGKKSLNSIAKEGRKKERKKWRSALPDCCFVYTSILLRLRAVLPTLILRVFWVGGGRLKSRCKYYKGWDRGRLDLDLHNYFSVLTHLEDSYAAASLHSTRTQKKQLSNISPMCSFHAFCRERKKEMNDKTEEVRRSFRTCTGYMLKELSSLMSFSLEV